MISGGRPFVPEILDQTDRVSTKIADFRPIFARSASAVTAVWKLSGTKL